MELLYYIIRCNNKMSYYKKNSGFDSKIEINTNC